jgi:EAL domain-containing protein (putative c-di-GMP-specific phosphodiesterase class I)
MAINKKNENPKLLGNLDQLLREALVRQEFLLYYQPYLDLTTQKVAGLEALIRWKHPLHGNISPDHFIPHAERSDLIGLISEWVLEQACAQMKRWHALGIEVPTMSINVSPRQFDRGTMPALVKTILTQNNLALWQLDLEITESSVPLDEKTMCEDVAVLRELGVKISIDDFGTGHSSLKRLRTMQIDRLKIDRSFVSNIALNPMDECLVRSMIHLAQQLGVTVIAEGIEDLETYLVLRSLGSDQGQGFYFSRALSATDCEKYLRSMQSLHRIELREPLAEVA